MTLKQTIAKLKAFKKLKKSKIYRHLYHLHVLMLLRYNKILRIFAILLFSFEMLAPALWLGEHESSITQKSTTYFNNQNQPVDLLTHLICEEASNEEREGKDDYLLGVCFVEVFNELQKFQSVQITWSLPKDRFDIQPSLYTLHRVLLI
jgi:hypothetical protein